MVRVPVGEEAGGNAPDPRPVLDWIRGFNAGACDDLILLTGEGLRRLLACMEKNEPALRADFVAQLARVRKIGFGELILSFWRGFSRGRRRFGGWCFGRRRLCLWFCGHSRCGGSFLFRR